MDIRFVLQRYGIMLFCCILIVYSCFCIFTGDRGLPRYFFLQKEIKNAQDIDKNYISQRKKMEKKVQNFSSKSLDLDLLEERARVVLNYVEKDDFVILSNK